MDRPFVTVVVPTRNRERLLADALNSLLDQDYPPTLYEIVVVDDASTDGTSRMAEAFSQRTQPPDLRFLRQPRKNQNAARNKGVADGNGQLIAFLDDDELAPPEWLSGLVDAARRHPEADCVGGPYRLRFEGRPPRFCAECWPGEGTLDLGDSERLVDRVCGGNMMIRRRVFDLVGPFDESLSGYWDETEWMLRLAAVGGHVVYSPAPWIVHRRTPDMLRFSRRIRKAFAIGRQEVRFLRKVGRPVRAFRRLVGTPRLLGHAMKRQCSEGVMRASTALGLVAETLWSRTHP